MTSETSPNLLLRATVPLADFSNEAVETSIPERFEKSVLPYPDRLAIKMGERLQTCDELDKEANRIAHAILRKPGPANESVALLFDHPVETVAPRVVRVGVIANQKVTVFAHPEVQTDLESELFMNSCCARIIGS